MANGIRVTARGDQVVLTMYVDDKDMGWVEYNNEQIGFLLRLIRAHQKLLNRKNIFQRIADKFTRGKTNENNG